MVLAGSAASAGTFNLVTGDDYPPLTSKDRLNGGLATDIVQTVFREMGHRTDVSFKPWSRGFKDALAGKYLATFPYAKNDKREADFLYSEPLYPLTLYLFAAANSDVRYDSDEDLRGKTVCLPLGFNPVKLADLESAGIINPLVRPPKLANCFDQLALNRVDLVRVSDVIGWYTIVERFGSRERFRQLQRPFGDGSPEYLIISKGVDGAAQIIDAFNAALARLKSDGRMEALIERHLR